MKDDRKTFVLVHGAWHGAWCWNLLLPLLQQAGHRVLAPDLPGHGQDSTPLQRLSLKTYTRALIQLLVDCDEKVILVGHSMGGMVISQVADQLAQKIQRLVYLAAFLPRHGQSVFDLMVANRSPQAEPGFTDTGSKGTDEFERETDSSAILEPETAIAKHLEISSDKRRCRIAPAVLASLFYNRCAAQQAAWACSQFAEQAILPLSGRISLDSGGFDQLPKTYISCLQDRIIPVQHQHRMITRQPCDELLQLDSDHSPFLSMPQELADMLVKLTHQSY